MPFEAKTDPILAGFEEFAKRPIEQVIEDALKQTHPHADEHLWMRFEHCTDEEIEKLKLYFSGEIKELAENTPLKSPRHFFVLGNYFHFVLKNYKVAFYCYQKAEQGADVGALNHLGYMFLDGIHVTKAPLKANDYFTQAIAKGSIMALVNLSHLHFDQKQNFEGMVSLKKAVELGSATATSFMATRHVNGVILDDTSIAYYKKETAKYYEMAAKNGAVSALSKLATIYQTGYANYSKDLDRAAYYYEICLQYQRNTHERHETIVQLAAIYKNFTMLGNQFAAERFFITHYQVIPNFLYFLAEIYAKGHPAIKNLDKAATYYYLNFKKNKHYESQQGLDTLHTTYSQVAFFYNFTTKNLLNKHFIITFNNMAMDSPDLFDELLETNRHALKSLNYDTYATVTKRINDKVLIRFSAMKKFILVEPAKIVNAYLMGAKSEIYCTGRFFILSDKYKPQKPVPTPVVLEKTKSRFPNIFRPR